MCMPDPVVASVRIAASPEVVFPYFTDPALIVTWIGDRAETEKEEGHGGHGSEGPDGDTEGPDSQQHEELAHA